MQYLIDSTASMGIETKNISSILIQHSQQLYETYSNYDFQFGFVYYNDPIDVISEYNHYYNLTKDINQLGQYCDNCQNQGGGDMAEDWVGGYNLSLYKIKWRNGKRIIIHICDSPAHGKKYSKDSDDNHKDKKFELELDDMMKKCAEKNIEIIGIYKDDSAKYCFEECKKIYDKNRGKSFVIQFYNQNSPFPFDLI